MQLDQVDRVAKLRDQRAAALRLAAAARTGSVGDFTMWLEGRQMNVFGVISQEPIRAAVAVAAIDYVDKIDEELRTLGVTPPRDIDRPPQNDTVQQWKETAEMFQRAWLRELGGNLIPKTHFIDALVLTTRDVVERAAKARIVNAGD